MVRITILILLFALIFSPAQLVAQEVPIDSVVAWFQNYCDQTQQLKAFSIITTPINESDTYYSTPSPSIPPYRGVRVEEKYDTSVVKDAFEFFVRSITIADCTGGCDSVKEASSLIGSNEGNYIQDKILALYEWWGFTADFNEISDGLYVGVSYMAEYYSYIWNKIGPSYFDHLRSETDKDTSFQTGIRIAIDYLKGCESPIDTMETLALEIIHEAAESDGFRQKYELSYPLIDVYLKGYQEVYNDINTIWNDPSPSINGTIDFRIRKEQQNNHLLMEFQKTNE